MKALSVKQPYACALADWSKNKEFRTRPTNHRGDLLICSSKSEKDYWSNTNPSYPLPTGVMLVVRNLVNCRPMVESDKEEFGAPKDCAGWYVWEFDPDEGDTVIPKAVNGSLNLFNVDDGLIESIVGEKIWSDFDYPNKDKKPPKKVIGV